VYPRPNIAVFVPRDEETRHRTVPDAATAERLRDHRKRISVTIRHLGERVQLACMLASFRRHGVSPPTVGCQRIQRRKEMQLPSGRASTFVSRPVDPSRRGGSPFRLPNCSAATSDNHLGRAQRQRQRQSAHASFGFYVKAAAAAASAAAAAAAAAVFAPSGCVKPTVFFETILLGGERRSDRRSKKAAPRGSLRDEQCRISLSLVDANETRMSKSVSGRMFLLLFLYSITRLIMKEVIEVNPIFTDAFCTSDFFVLRWGRLANAGTVIID
jgi:hypothetical protein